jgi:hypothetical protein
MAFESFIWLVVSFQRAVLGGTSGAAVPVSGRLRRFEAAVGTGLVTYSSNKTNAE